MLQVVHFVRNAGRLVAIHKNARRTRHIHQRLATASVHFVSSSPLISSDFHRHTRYSLHNHLVVAHTVVVVGHHTAAVVDHIAAVAARILVDLEVAVPIKSIKVSLNSCYAKSVRAQVSLVST